MVKHWKSLMDEGNVRRSIYQSLISIVFAAGFSLWWNIHEQFIFLPSGLLFFLFLSMEFLKTRGGAWTCKLDETLLIRYSTLFFEEVTGDPWLQACIASDSFAISSGYCDSGGCRSGNNCVDTLETPLEFLRNSDNVE